MKVINRFRIFKLKRLIRKQLEELITLRNSYSCGNEMLMTVSPRARELKLKMDKDWASLQKLDSTCPRGNWE
jgi:hypothetical protein